MEKTLKPALRFKGFTDAWEQREFGDILNTHPFKAFLANPSIDGEFEVIQQGAFPIIGYANGEPFTDFDDIVLFGDHTVSIYHPRKPFFLATDGVKIVSSKGINGDFLYYMFEKYRPIQQGYTRHFLMLKEVHTSYPKSSKEMVMISSFLCKIDTLITLHQRKHEKLINVKKALLDKMFPKNGELVPQLRFKGFTDTWEQRELGKIGSTYTGLSGKGSNDFGHGDGRYVTYLNVFGNPISNPEIVEKVEIDKSQNQVAYGDVFFTTSSETPEEVGMSSIWLSKAKDTYLNSFCFGYRPSIEIDPYYLGYMLRSPGFRSKMIVLAQGISRYNISKTKAMQLSILLPSLQEQIKIGKALNTISNLITLHQRKYEKLVNVKKALLQKMFV